jgi:hypothetical protein
MTNHCICVFKPTIKNSGLYLGKFVSCQGTILDAKKLPRTADGCYYCTCECNS